MFAKALLVGVLAAFAAAQGTSSTLSFTRVPNPITAGQQQALLYATSNSNAPVTILLRKGNPNDLETVATLTTTATNGQYIWTPELSLENGSDYALEIKQGDQLNYYGPFQIQGGGQSSSSSSSSSSSGSATAIMSSTHSGSSSAIATITASQNATAITTATISSGTGMSMPRNTTMSSATLSRTSSEASATTSASRSSNGAGFQGSQTSASAPANTGAASSLIVTGSSAIALAFGAVAAVFFC